MQEETLTQQIATAIAHIRTKTNMQPRFGIILGTGLGKLSEEIQAIYNIPYTDIPGFPKSTVQSHKGELIFGELAGQPVVAMAGRFHYYEGYSMKQVTFPVRVMQQLGIEKLIISNVSGSTNADIEAGDICFVRDHINLQPDNPLRGTNEEKFGPRFPDMLHTYDKTMRDMAKEIATAKGIRHHEAVYVALPGPNLETPAEYNFLNRMGGDLVGMSTVPEVLVARHMGLPVFVISVVSNKCFPIEAITETTVEEVIAIAAKAEPQMTAIVKGLLEKIKI